MSVGGGGEDGGDKNKFIFDVRRYSSMMKHYIVFPYQNEQKNY